MLIDNYLEMGNKNLDKGLHFFTCAKLFTCAINWEGKSWERGKLEGRKKMLCFDCVKCKALIRCSFGDTLDN